ncbi:MAG TPA: PDZ domain-containing protein [Xanthomonadales bacterium]|nr:PDZ domain-containing protein [Xanthomonadales bacterium]
MLIASTILLACGATNLFAQDRAAVRHQISFPERDTQYVLVRSRFPADGESLELIMPSWTPGSYQIREYATHVESVTASTSGQPLPIRKTAKNRWLIDAPGTASVQVTYKVWAGTLSVQENWVESDFALLIPAGLFLYSEKSFSLPQHMEIALPNEWDGVAVALPGPDSQGRYIAKNFDELVDSPILAGDITRRSMNADGIDFALVNYGETNLWDGDQAMNDLAKIVSTQLEFWGVRPFDREYLFLNILMSGGGGLEHDHSTVMMTSPGAMRSREDYVKWMALAAHEFFHAWNVRRMRPAALAEYNYEEEVYTRQLWIAEGLTSYYDNLLLFRAAVITVAELFDLLALEIQQYEAQPGRYATSAEHASFDSWIKQYRKTPNTVNSYSNYYRQGALIGFVIDSAIRQATRNRKSLDDAMRRMYELYGPQGESHGSYPPRALRDIVTEIAGEETGSLLESMTTEIIDPDVDAALEWYGLRLVRDSDRQAALQSGVPVPVDLGVTWQTDTPLLLIENVFLGGAGADAGLIPGDELLAIGGYRVTRDNLDSVLNTLRQGNGVNLTLARHQRLIERSITVQAAKSAKYLITIQDKVSNAQERRLERWLGRPLLIKQ